MIEVVGIQASGVSSLPDDLRALVDNAATVVGPPRILQTLPDSGDQRRVEWPRPMLPQLDTFLEDLAEGPQPVVVLASGDPLDSGVGTTLIDRIGSDGVRIHPTIGSVTLARARMGWSSADTDVLSLVSTPVYAIRPLLTPGRRILLLSADQFTPTSVVNELDEMEWLDARVTVLGSLGTEDESRQEFTVRDFPDPDDVPRLNVIAVELPWLAQTMGTSPGRPDDDYEHDGQLTKQEIRVSALAALRPAPGQVLWDIGAGAGSIAIEWVLHDPRCYAVAVERDPDRARRIIRNAEYMGATGVEVITGDSEDELIGLPRPDAVFIGGGASEAMIDTGWETLTPGGRLVVHAVTLETEQVLIDAMRRHGGTLRRITIERAESLGRFLSWKPGRPVVEWAATRPLVDPRSQL